MSMNTGYSIRKAAELSGLTPYVIRAWESRYSVVEPRRTKGNQRSYNDADVRRLKLLAEGVAAGYRIGRIALMSDGDLTALMQSDTENGIGCDADGPMGALTRIRNAVKDLDAQKIASILDDTALGIGLLSCIDNVIVPFLEDIGTGWHEGRWRIYHEHIASASIRNFLGKHLDAIVPSVDDPVAVVATPGGQEHDIGSLSVAVAASLSGYRVFYTGSGIPLEEVADIIKKQDARLVLLSVVFPRSIHRISRDIDAMQRRLPENCRLIIGGPSARFLESSVKALSPAKMYDLHRFLGKIRNQIR